MNEHEISELIRDYGAAMPEFRPKPAPKPIGRYILYASALAATGAVALLMTQSAQASGYQQMVDALKGVHTMEAVMYHHGMNGQYRVLARTWISGSKLADEVIKSERLHDLVVSTPTDYYYNFMYLGVTTREPPVSDPFDGKKTALDWVRAWNDVGRTGVPQTIRKLASPPLNGHDAYKLEFEKRTGLPAPSHTLVTIWVDSANHLPIRCAVLDEEQGRQPDMLYTDFRFNVPVPEAVFAPRFKPVVDLVSRQKALAEQWKAAPAAKSPHATVLDAQVAEDGSLYILYVGPWAPAAVRGYVKAADFQPGGVRGDTKTAQRLDQFQHPIWGAVFVPAKLDRKVERSLQVALRPVAEEGFMKITTKSGPDENITVIAKPCGKWPDYTFDLVLSSFFFQTDGQRALAQAKALDAGGEIDGALRVYRQGFEDRKSIFPSTAYRTLIPAEAMLRRVGRIREADALKVEIQAGIDKDPNRKPTAVKP